MTEGRDVPGDDEAPPTGESEAGDGATEPPAADLPLPEPPTSGWAPGVQWAPVLEEHHVLPPAGVKLEVASVVRRTLDMFVANWMFFVVLAIPSAAIAVVTTIILSGSTSAAFGLFASLGTIAVDIIFTMAMIVAADDLRVGRTLDYGTVIGRAVDRVGAAFLSALAQFVLLVCFVVVALLVVIPVGLAGTGGLLISLIVAIAAIVLLVAVAIRWSLSQAAIVLDGFGPLKSLGRSRAVTKGNAWRIFALFAVFGLLFLPLSIGVSGLSFIPRTPVVLLLLVVSSLLSGPLTAIANSIAYGDLTGRPAIERGPATTGNARSILIAAILVVGAIALVLGAPNIAPGLSRLSPGFVPPEDRGKILVGTVPNPLDLCKPSEVNTTFSTSDTLYIGGYFTKPIPAGESGTVDVYANGTKANSAPLTNPSRAIACYAEQDPLVGARPGTYRLVVTYGGETIAEGSFTVR